MSQPREVGVLILRPRKKGRLIHHLSRGGPVALHASEGGGVFSGVPCFNSARGRPGSTVWALNTLQVHPHAADQSPL